MSNFKANEAQRRSTPLPRLQLLTVYLIQLAEPITGLVILPFIAQLVRDTNVTNGDETKTGYYAGVIESAFFLAQCLSVVQWGYLSDRVGRRPVLLLGSLGLSVSMLLFGLSKSFWPLVVFRCLQGVFNGNVGVGKTVIAEITDETNIGDAYAYHPIVWSYAMTISPVLGGVLSNPAERWPNVFGRLPFFKSYPYFLPCAISSFIVFLSFVLAFLALEETLPSIVMKKKQMQQLRAADAEASLIKHSDNINYGAVISAGDNTPIEECPGTTDENRKSTSYTLLHRPLILIFLNYVFLSFLKMAHGVLIPLVYSTPVEYGGLGLTPSTIGTLLGTFGLVNTIFQAKFLRYLIRRFGTRRLYKITMLSPCVVFAIYPVMKYAALRAGGTDGYVYVCIVIHLACKAPLYMAYGCLQVLVVQSLPEGGSISTANSIVQLLVSAMRTIAPSVASSLFSISLQRNLANGNLVYYFLFGTSLLSVRLSWLLRDPAETKEKPGSAS